MNRPLRISRSGGAAFAAAILAMGLVTAPPVKAGPSSLRVDTVSAHVEAVILSAVVHEASFAEVAPSAYAAAVEAAETPHPVADFIERIRTAVAALRDRVVATVTSLREKAVAALNSLRDKAVDVAISLLVKAAAPVLLPAWFLAFPISLRITQNYLKETDPFFSDYFVNQPDPYGVQALYRQLKTLYTFITYPSGLLADLGGFLSTLFPADAAAAAAKQPTVNAAGARPAANSASENAVEFHEEVSTADNTDGTDNTTDTASPRGIAASIARSGSAGPGPTIDGPPIGAAAGPASPAPEAATAASRQAARHAAITAATDTSRRGPAASRGGDSSQENSGEGP